jgi:hypothetical protein
MPEYDHTPAGEIRRTVADGTFQLVNDPEKIARAMIGLIDRGEVPLRLPLGPDAYRHVRASLVGRLAELDAHRETALSVLRDDLPTEHMAG